MSYGTNAPQGFVEENALLSHTSNSSLGTYTLATGYATSIFTGDPVARAANGVLARGVAGAAVVGVFKGVNFTDSAGVTQYLPYWPASTAATNIVAYVIDDPTVEFNIQVTGNSPSGGTATANAVDIGKNANFVIGTGSTITGFSGTSLNMASLDVTATLNCALIRLTPGFGSTIVGAPGTPTNQQNAFGTSFNNVVVTFNNHSQKGGTGTVGV
jgi:hypothetical protein